MDTNSNLLMICCICREALINGDESGELTVSVRCGHAFHSDCIRSWFQQNAHRYGDVDGSIIGTCPVCNTYFSLSLGVQLFLSTVEDTESSTRLETLEGKLEVAVKEAKSLKSEVNSLKTTTNSQMDDIKVLRNVNGFQRGKIISLQTENRYLKLRRQSLEKAVADAQATSTKQTNRRYVLLTDKKGEVEATGSSLKGGPPQSKIATRTKTQKKKNASEETAGAGPAPYSGPVTRSRTRGLKKC